MKGVLLIAVGVDPNNGYFHVAWAVVEVEDKPSWEWFLELLRNDLRIEKHNTHEWTLMSDKQKGLIRACEIQFPYAEHRFCVKYLHANFTEAGYKGHALRKALWAAAKATTEGQFDEKMEVLTCISSDAAAWLRQKPGQQWCRVFFSTKSKCDLLLNNICESLNSKILDARSAPIVGILEGMRMYLTRRMLENCTLATQKWKNKRICPRIFKRVEAYMKMATELIPYPSSKSHVEIHCPDDEKYAVNLDANECSCRKWQLTGIPCIHGIAALWTVKKDPLDYIDEYYSVETYFQCYEPFIYPLNGETEWEKVPDPPMLPPLQKKVKGRPTMKRKRSVAEVILSKEDNKYTLSRKGQRNNCRHCNKGGHNIRTCQERNDATGGITLENIGGQNYGTDLSHSDQFVNIELQLDHEIRNCPSAVDMGSTFDINVDSYQFQTNDEEQKQYASEDPRAMISHGFNPPRRSADEVRRGQIPAVTSLVEEVVSSSQAVNKVSRSTKSRGTSFKRNSSSKGTFKLVDEKSDEENIPKELQPRKSLREAFGMPTPLYLFRQPPECKNEKKTTSRAVGTQVTSQEGKIMPNAK